MLEDSFLVIFLILCVDAHWQFMINLMTPNWMVRDIHSCKQHDLDRPSTVTRIWAGRRGNRGSTRGREKKIFHSEKTPKRLTGTPIQWEPMGSFLGGHTAVT
jgi:hypothetical protein